VIEGKKVVLVEDSIVRGNTSKPLVDYIRKKGKALEVHVRVSCTPIRAPCFYGIDMSTLTEMIAVQHMDKKQLEERGDADINEKTIEGIRKEIKADTLQYQTLDGLVKALDFEDGKKSLCLACVTGEYPTPFGEKLYQISKTNLEKGIKGRTHELEVKS
jgi:amidophosphoribosyltransferase